MRRNSLQCRGRGQMNRRQHSPRRFRPLVEMLESRLVPSTITSITPNTVPEGNPTVTMTVNGSGFLPGSNVKWQGNTGLTQDSAILTTTFVSSSQLTAVVPASLLAEESTPEHGGPVSILVIGADGDSNAVPFTVQELAVVAQGGGFVSGQILANVTLATFKDPGGPEVNGPQNYTNTVDWGDGSFLDSGMISGPDMNGVYTITASHAYADTSPSTIKTTIFHEGTSVTVITPVNENEGPVTATGGFTINGVEGQLINGAKVATFTVSNDPGSVAGDFSASIAWGDGTTSGGAISGPDGSGVFTVTGSHTYKEEGTPDHGGPYVITVTILHEGANPASVTDSTNITDAPLSATGGFTFTGPTLTNVTLATFTDTGGPEPLVDYSASIAWGDGATTAGTISGPSGSGVFTVTGSHTYATTGAFTITVTLTHETAPPVSVTDKVGENEGPVSATGGFTITGVEGQPINNVKLATFTTPGDVSVPADFSVTVKWGDGTTSGATVTGPDASGVFTVLGSHTYAEEGATNHGGPFVISVTILHEGANPVTVTDPTNITDAPLSATGGFTFTGPTLTNVTLATFTDSGGPEPLVDYSASINWGDGTTSGGTITGPNGGGKFTVTGSHTYSVSGSLTITVTITHETAPPVTVTDLVTNPPNNIVTASGGFTVFGVEGSPITNATVATFTSSNPNAKASDFTASIKWGDGPFQNVNDVNAGTISGPDASGVFTVTGSYTYIEESDDVGQNADTPSATPFYIITVTIQPSQGPAAAALSQGRIFDAQLNVTGGFNVAGTAGQPTGTVTLATFVDPGGQIEIGTNIYIATIDWGDGSSQDTQGFTGSGALTVTGSHAYATAGTFTITVTLNHEFAAPVSVTDTATIAPAVAPPGPGGGGAGGAQQGSPVLLQVSPTATDPAVQWAALQAKPSASVLSGQSSEDADTYWQRRENWITDPNGQAAYELAWALESTVLGGASAPSGYAV